MTDAVPRRYCAKTFQASHGRARLHIIDSFARKRTVCGLDVEEGRYWVVRSKPQTGERLCGSCLRMAPETP